MRILPGVLKELIKHVPTVLFNAVDWNILAHELPKLSRRLLKKEGHHDLLEHQNRILAPLNIKLTDDVIDTHQNQISKTQAEKILALYFGQLFSQEGLFLDLRPTNFQFSSDTLYWSPPALWTHFNQDFQYGLIDIYDGFYFDKDELFHKGLKKIGLVGEDWSLEDKDKLSELFRAHFGSSLSEEMVFNVENFKASLMKITDFLLEKKVKISTDFMYLGIYLITLYSSLELSSGPLPVKRIYQEVRANFDTTLIAHH